MKQYHFISKAAIYILSFVLIGFGLFHFMNPYDLFVYVPEFLPGGVTWVYVTGGALMLVGLSFLTNRYVKLTSYVLAILILIVILFIHLPNALNAGVPEMRRLALLNLIKDAAIFGFALHIAASAHHQHLHFEESD
jgi:putative oxidoreductase